MANETRMNKYKDLRDTFQDADHKTTRHIDDTVTDDDFLSFLPRNDEKDELHPLTYDTLEDDEVVRTAINEAKINVGKEQYNTRAEILNRIRNEETITEPTKVFDPHEVSHEVEETEDTSEAKQKIDYSETSLSQDNAEIRPFSVGDPNEEHVANEEAEPVVLSKKEIKALKKEEKKKQKALLKEEKEKQKALEKEEKLKKAQELEEETYDDVEEDIDENYEEIEENRFVSTLLSVIIILLILVLVAICVFYAKDYIL